MRNFNKKHILVTAILATSLFSSISQAECGSELQQLQGFKTQLGNHLRADNVDTRFIINRNDTGVFKHMRNVGLFHTIETVTVNGKSTNVAHTGSATILNGCYAITSYHAVEGSEILMNAVNKKPLKNRLVNFYFGAVNGTHQGFSNSISGNVVDPGILNLSNRRLADDIVLIKFSKKLQNDSFEQVNIGSIYNRKLNKSAPTDFREQFFTAAGYPQSKMTTVGTAALYADFCNPKEQTLDAGITTNCILTPRQSGGPFTMYEKMDGSDSYSKTIVGLAIQSSDDSSGLFAKNSMARSKITAFTPKHIAAINAIINQKLDESCNEIK